MTVSTDQWRGAVNDLVKSAKAATHRPLLLLFLLARARDGKSRTVSFLEIENSLADILSETGSAKRPEPLLPFWHMRTTGFWEVLDEASLPRRKGKDRPTRTGLITANAVGAVRAEWWTVLVQNLALPTELADLLISRCWLSDDDQRRARAFFECT